MKRKILYAMLFIIIIGCTFTIYIQSTKDNRYNDNVTEKHDNEEYNKEREEKNNKNNTPEQKNKDLYGYTFYSGFISNMTSLDDKIIITNYESLEDYCHKYNNYTYDEQGNILYGRLDKLLTQYDNNFFQENSLAIQYVEKTSGSDEVQFINASIIDEDKIKVNYRIIKPEIGTCDMSGVLIIVEINKDIIDII